ncbi:hypothetical protein E2C01_072690 [Portunus trituberculatus]|uniref:Uncharacterized protein n=1 Tax=Portunus trituberculatus TaxID=210409 RepID=A0A5B7IBD9_PORTR|nr:hypothetical protein [Portunus trituberculatus]
MAPGRTLPLQGSAPAVPWV